MQPRETDFVGRAWCGRGLRDRHPSTTRPTARSLPLGARAPGRQGGASTPSRSHSPRTSSARLVDRTATGATRPWRRQRATASRPLAGPRPARTLTNSPRDTSSCASDGPLISSRDRAPAAVTVAREPTAASSQPKGCAPTPVDETYVRVKGRWCYLYRALDSTGATINFVLSGLRDVATATRLFRKALTDLSHPPPRVINTDQARLYGSAISGVKKAGLLRRRCRHRPVQYVNNILE